MNPCCELTLNRAEEGWSVGLKFEDGSTETRVFTDELALLRLIITHLDVTDGAEVCSFSIALSAKLQAYATENGVTIDEALVAAIDMAYATVPAPPNP